ncbi:ABC transporter substrate-binding protein [Gluconobacter cerinus]|uniref:ABC transporter substrate-binding protein n=2 Tax=Gluconobacter cerinus TaxID=38307 RepID=UPI001B8C362C|nr:ABC transporter substrate-binding protein [Gluconobacter cerinus]MBS1032570.1 ABC transporter substrate-binding protein [Gluconobacter cerinus]
MSRSPNNPVSNDIREPIPPEQNTRWGRRAMVLGGLASVVGGTLLAARHSGAHPLPRTADGLRIIRLSLPVNAPCVAPMILAEQTGLYRDRGLKVEFTNWTDTPSLLEAVATGKVDAGAGMIMQFMRPLEQGFDLKLVAGTHGGCMRMVGSRRAGITKDISSVRGKTIGIADATGFAYNTFALLLKSNGIDPLQDVVWQVYPAPLLEAALMRGDIQAYADSDPLMYSAQRRSGGDLVEILSNLAAPWQGRVCCVVAASNTVLRRDRSAVLAMIDAMIEAAEICVADPMEVAKAFVQYGAIKAPVEDIAAVLRMQTHHMHPVGHDLAAEVAFYAAQLKTIGVMSADLDPQAFAQNIVDDVTKGEPMHV